MAKDVMKESLKLQEHLERLCGDEDFPAPPLPGEGELHPKTAAWLKEQEEKDAKEYEETIAANVRALNGRRGALQYPTVPQRSFVLSKAHPRVTLVARPWYRRDEWWMRKGDAKTVRLGRTPYLTVTGLGPYPGRRKARLGDVDMTVLGLKDKLADVGITCDGEASLPDIATHVRFRLNDSKAVVTVAVDSRVSRSFAPCPERWIVRGWWVEPDHPRLDEDDP